MKLQFGVRSLLVATACVGIWVAGVAAMPRVYGAIIGPGIDTAEMTAVFFFLAPAWLPLAFGGYSIGRRSLTPGMLLALAAMQVFALAAAAAAIRMYIR